MINQQQDDTERYTGGSSKIPPVILPLLRFFKYLVLGPVVAWRRFVGPRNFVFRAQSYQYIHSLYNLSFFTERTIEIPIAGEMLRRFKGKQILEVGNVMAHYMTVEHEVVD